MRRASIVALMCLALGAHCTQGRLAAAAGVILPNGEPDAKAAELRLWLRADSGVEDAAGRSPGDAAFSGAVAAWRDRSTNKYDLAAPPGRAALYLSRHPAAAGRPAVAFNGRQLLMRNKSALHDRHASTTVLVMQNDAGRGGPCVYAAGLGQGQREMLRLSYTNPAAPALTAVQWLVPTAAGEREFQIPLEHFGDARSGSRLNVIIYQCDGERSSAEIHDALGDFMGVSREVSPAEFHPQSDRCAAEFYLGAENAQEALPFVGKIAEFIVYDRVLTAAELQSLVVYLRSRYGLDAVDALFPPDVLLVQAEDFHGNWKRNDGRAPQCLNGRFVQAEGPDADQGIKTTVLLPHAGVYHVWVRAIESGYETSPPNHKSAIRTSVQGKPLAVTHYTGPGGFRWRQAGSVELAAGPAEIDVRGEGPGPKNVDAVLLSPTVEDADVIDDLCCLAARLRGLAGSARLAVLFDSGRRLVGAIESGFRWLDPQSRPDGAPVRGPARESVTRGGMPKPVCVQWDSRQREASVSAEALFEFLNGDRLRGTIQGYTPAVPLRGGPGGAPLGAGLLLLQPAAEVGFDQAKRLAIDTSWLRRVAFVPPPRGLACPPGALLVRDGSKHSFQALRWGAEAVTLLTDDGVERIPLERIAELRMPESNAWEAYYRELKRLDSNVAGDILHVETLEGIALTGAASSTTAISEGNAPFATRRLMQPVWSREAIPVAWDRARFVWQAPASVVPLSRFVPDRVTQGGALGSSWKWQANRNVAGGRLECAGLEGFWGFGVHASNELAFRLPDCAAGFRAGVGLDADAGDVGTVAATVRLDPAGSILFQSGRLASSRRLTFTGVLPLPPADHEHTARGRERQLLLAVQHASDGPDGTGDPLDIGDHADWLEPTLLLDPALLRAEVRKGL